MTSDGKPHQVHLIDHRTMAFGTVCGVIATALQIGIYSESLLLLGDKTIVRREVYYGITRVKRSNRCKTCFRRVGKVL